MPRLHLAAMLIATALVCPVATAEGDASCDGLWKGDYVDSARRRVAPVDLTIAGNSGSWVAHLGVDQKSKNSPCREVSFPVRVHRCTESELEFSVDGASVILGCPSFKARLIRHGLDSAEGVKGRNVQKLDLTRQP